MSTVVVTGAAKRIGRAICLHLARHGYDIVVHARSGGADVVAEIETLGQSAWLVGGDLATPDGATTMLAEASKAAGKIAHIVHNASSYLAGDLGTATAVDFAAMMNLHAWGPLSADRALAAAGGQGSVYILDARTSSLDPQHFLYLTSKQTATHLVRTSAAALAPFRVNGVAPGPILEAADGGSLDAAVDATLLNRAGTPDEVAHAVRFLLEAQYTTGEVIRVDGGRHTR